MQKDHYAAIYYLCNDAENIDIQVRDSVSACDAEKALAKFRAGKVERGKYGEIGNAVLESIVFVTIGWNNELEMNVQKDFSPRYWINADIEPLDQDSVGPDRYSQLRMFGYDRQAMPRHNPDRVMAAHMDDIIINE